MGTFVETRQTTFEIIECGACGIPFGLTDRFYRARREDKGTFYCPNGHGRAYVESEADILRAKLEAEKGHSAFWRGEQRLAEDRAERERRSKAAVKGQLTKERKRVANGVCPCCNRTFANLSRHMAGQHPEYVESPTGED